jgi:hypothetical protein
MHAGWMALFGDNIFVGGLTHCLLTRRSCASNLHAVSDTASSPFVTRKALQQAHGRAAEDMHEHADGGPAKRLHSIGEALG